MKRRSFLALLWGAVAAFFVPKSKRLPPGVGWENGKLYKLGPSTDCEVPSRTEFRENPKGGFLVREFYDGNRRRGGGGTMIVVVHRDAEVLTSGYLDSPPPKPSWFGKVRGLFRKTPREERGPGLIRRA